MSTFKINESTKQKLAQFKEYMLVQDYAKSSVIGYYTYLSRFLRRPARNEGDSLSERIIVFLEKEKTNSPQTIKDCRAALHLYFTMETGQKMLTSKKANGIPENDELLQRFYDYSVGVKHLQLATAVSEVSHIRRFLECAFKLDPLRDTAMLTAEDIRCYVMEHLRNLSDSSKGHIVTSLRNFFRFQAFYGNFVHPSILRMPLSPAVWKKSAFPTTLDDDVFESLHTIPDGNTAVGKRNRCIILCFTELALRCSEVANLTLDAFSWHSGCVSIRKTKNGAERALPLSDRLGRSIVDYLSEVRPQTSSRALFVRFKHKCGEPMGCGQIRGVVRRSSAKAGLEDKFCGTHILRRTVATKLYNSGNSLKMTADILGHESLDSTIHYAKTDMAGLLTVASPWLGGEHIVR